MDNITNTTKVLPNTFNMTKCKDLTHLLRKRYVYGEVGCAINLKSKTTMTRKGFITTCKKKSVVRDETSYVTIFSGDMDSTSICKTCPIRDKIHNGEEFEPPVGILLIDNIMDFN